MKNEKKEDLIEKRMNYWHKHKYKCYNCDCMVLIPPEKESRLCRWCNHLVFRTKEEYDEYYKKQNFMQNLRKAIDRNKNGKNIINN